MAGIYMAIRYSQASARDIQTKILNLIPNPVPVDELHTTIIFSTKTDQFPVHDWELYHGLITEYKIWYSPENKTQALIAVLDSDKVVRRHEYLMKNYDLDYRHDSFIPHITMSYNVPKDFDFSHLPINISVIGNDEYTEVLREY